MEITKEACGVIRQEQLELIVEIGLVGAVENFVPGQAPVVIYRLFDFEEISNLTVDLRRR